MRFVGLATSSSLLFAFLACISKTTHAETPDSEAGGAGPGPRRAEAVAHFERGQVHYDVAEWRAAASEFKQAYRLDPDPAFLFNLAQASRLGGDCLAAHDQYKTFLRTTEPSVPTRVVAENFVRELESCARQRRFERTRKPRHPNLRLAAKVVPWPSLALLATGSVFLYRARTAGREVSDAYASANLVWTDRLEELEHRGPRDQKIGFGLAAVGAAGLACSVVMWQLGREDESVTIEPTEGGGEVSVRWAF